MTFNLLEKIKIRVYKNMYVNHKIKIHAYATEQQW
jgi:hypothetical protein